jgi:hypothetical protein
VSDGSFDKYVRPHVPVGLHDLGSQLVRLRDLRLYPIEGLRAFLTERGSSPIWGIGGGAKGALGRSARDVCSFAFGWTHPLVGPSEAGVQSSITTAPCAVVAVLHAISRRACVLVDDPDDGPRGLRFG